MLSPSTDGGKIDIAPRTASESHCFASPVPESHPINRAGLASLSSLLRRWLPEGRLLGHEYTACNPTRADSRPGSFRIIVNSGRWADFATGDKGGDVVSLAAYLSGTGQAEAARSLAEMLGVRHD